MAFGNGVLQPGESTKNAMKDAAEQVIYISVIFFIMMQHFWQGAQIFPSACMSCWGLTSRIRVIG